MQVKWLKRALLNLETETAHVAKNNPEAAYLMAERIQQAVLLLANQPAMGRVGRIPGTRELVIPNTRYIIPYRVRPELGRIELLRVFHTSRRLPEQW